MSVIKSLLKHPNLIQPKHVSEIISSGSTNNLNSLFGSKTDSITPEHINSILSRPTLSSHHISAINHHSTTGKMAEDYFEKNKNDERNSPILVTAANHKDVNPDTINASVNSLSNSYRKGDLISHINHSTPEMLSSVANGKNIVDHAYAISHHNNVDDSAYHSVVNNHAMSPASIDNFDLKVAQNHDNKLSSDTLRAIHLKNKEDYSLNLSLVRNHKTPSDVLETITGNGSLGNYPSMLALNHPNVTKKVLTNVANGLSHSDGAKTLLNHPLVDETHKQILSKFNRIGDEELLKKLS